MHQSSSSYSIPFPNLDLASTLMGGQTFRWQPTSTPNNFEGIASRHLWHISHGDGRLQVRCLAPSVPHLSAQDFALHYFDYGREYPSAMGYLRQDMVFEQITRGIGELRILRQEWFETLICFVVSANNHIKRISGIVERLCQMYGAAIPGTDPIRFSFPTPGQLAKCTTEDLRNHCRMGYRDRFIKTIAEQIADSEQTWSQADQWSFPQLQNRLLALPGVGPKVAHCIALFGFGRWEAFPIDTWVRRIMIGNYFPDQSPNNRHLLQFASERFGSYSGLAQQYLFEVARRRLS